MQARTRFSLFSLLSLAVLLMLVVPTIEAQIHGVPASVSSFGFGGNFSSAPGVAASVTSLGPNGFGNSRAVFGNCCFNGFRSGHQSPIFSGRRHGHGGNFFPLGVPVYTVPYTQVVVVQPEAVADDGDDSDVGEPVILEQRGARSRRVRERIVAPEPEPAAPTTVAVAEPIIAQPSTILVFVDGHQIEIENYAIVGDTLFDLAGNRVHKILLADLDLPATQKANNTRGVDFQVP